MDATGLSVGDELYVGERAKKVTIGANLARSFDKGYFVPHWFFLALQRST